MSSYEQLKPFFDEPARLQIRDDFSSKCVLCKEHLEPGEGHCVPLLNAHKTYLKCLKGLYTKLSMPRDARNGLYACQTCAHNWLMGTDDKRALATFIPCEPLMVYALHALNLASDVDEASRSQTLDELFYDLANDPDATPERRKAAPFLYCYQLFPVRAKPFTSNLDSSVLSVHQSPLTYIKDGDPVDGSRSTDSDDTQPAKGLNTYCIIEHDSNTVTATSRRVSLYRQLECEMMMLSPHYGDYRCGPLVCSSATLMLWWLQNQAIPSSCDFILRCVSDEGYLLGIGCRVYL